MSNNLTIQAQSCFINLPAGRFHYLSWGTEKTNLPVAVLLHGVTSSALSWSRVGPALATRYRVYALDLRGHGESVKLPASEYSLRTTADDVLDFIGALALEQDPSLLLGHSWGGAVALELASGTDSQRPIPAFARIVLVDPAVDMSQGDPVAMAASFSMDIGRPPAELRVEIARQNPTWDILDVEGKVDSLQCVTREAVSGVMVGLKSAGNLVPLLASLRVPTLLFRADPKAGWTTQNEANWAWAQQILTPPNLTVQIEGASHNIHRDNFAAFLNVVEDFLSKE